MSFPAEHLRLLPLRLRLCVGIGLWLLLLLLPPPLVARPMEGGTYQQMYDKADLVVIAKPLSSKDTEERTMLPGWEYIHVVGVNTELETRLVLKGDKTVKRFALHHYKLDSRLEPLPIN
jgi:hypothetical protein